MRNGRQSKYFSRLREGRKQLVKGIQARSRRAVKRTKRNQARLTNQSEGLEQIDVNEARNRLALQSSNTRITWEKCPFVSKNAAGVAGKY